MKVITTVLERWADPRVGTWARVLRTADEEARAAAHTRIDSEHLLLALVRAGEGQAAQHLRQLPVDADQIRELIVQAVDARGGDSQELGPSDLEADGLEHLDPAPGPSAAPRRRGLRAVLHRGRRTRRWTPEALAVLDTATERAHLNNHERPPAQRSLTDDDLAVALATTRGTRARDLLEQFELIDETSRAVRSRDASGDQ